MPFSIPCSYTIYIDVKAASIGTVDNIVQTINASSTLENVAGFSQIVASATGPIVGVGFITNTIALTLSAVTADADGANVGQLITATGNVLGIVAGAFAIAGVAVPALTVTAAVVTVGGAAYNFYELYNKYAPSPAISPTLGTTPDPLVKTIRYVDPLILDLDGNGLQITALSKGILFDANGDTIKTATAWAGAGDGMLVWDKNGNGSIDSGQELFGDETILTNGPNAGKKAANGFAALADLDTGSLVNGVLVGANDGVFDAKDAAYANLRIWRDLNQDGVSQADELQTLAQTGVQSIKLASTTTNTNYGDAILAQSGSAEHRKERARTCTRLKQRSLRGKYGCGPDEICASSYEICSKFLEKAEFNAE